MDEGKLKPRRGDVFRLTTWQGKPKAVLVGTKRSGRECRWVLLGLGGVIRGRVLTWGDRALSKAEFYGTMRDFATVPCPCCETGSVSYRAAKRALRRMRAVSA